MPFLERTEMKIGRPLQDQIDQQQRLIQDLANQHQQIAVNHAELLKMILQLQLQIVNLENQLLGGR